jgi:transposase-like protein
MLLAEGEEEAMQCQRCQSERFIKEGHDRQGRQVYRCRGCRRRRTEDSTSAFAGYRFPPDIIALAVRPARSRLGRN